MVGGTLKEYNPFCAVISVCQKPRTSRRQPHRQWRAHFESIGVSKSDLDSLAERPQSNEGRQVHFAGLDARLLGLGLSCHSPHATSLGGVFIFKQLKLI
jgi:hypothetical protein